MWQWVKKNILGELPVIGGFFKQGTLVEALQHSGKMTCELAGGSAGMILYMLHKEMPMGHKTMEHEVGYYAGMVGSMSAGMMTGAITYNTLMTLGKKTYGCLKKPQIEQEIDDPLAIESATEQTMGIRQI